MNQLLKLRRQVRLESTNMLCEIEQFLGAGGQGEVYKANLNGKPVALKWYFPQQATPEQQAALDMIIRRGSPDDKFLWPLGLAFLQNINGFGYLMSLREPRFKGIADLMRRRIEPSFRALATAGLELSHSFLQLHSKGLCYRDISFGNVFFDPDTGEIRICDNDNVTVDGEATGGILGTPRFMAPEVVRGEARPSIQTDLFSLAVLLFYM
ncbi:MAG: serine/threonine protein kinase, partial [Desulfobacteraceae bacterium 4572_88]